VFRKHGVVGAPRIAGNRFEFAWVDPQMFKRIFQFFLKLRCDKIEFHFTPSALYMYSRDCQDKMGVQVTVEGAEINWYYCSSEFWLMLNRQDVDKAFGAIDRSFTRIRIYNDETNPLRLVFELINDALSRTNRFPIDVSVPSGSVDDWAEIADLASDTEGYPLAWTLGQKELKKTHALATSHASTIKVEMCQGGFLRLQYRGTGIPPFVEEYRDPAAIQLEMRSDTLVIVDYSAESGSTFAAALPTDSVRMYCANDRPVMFVAKEAAVRLVTTLQREDI